MNENESKYLSLKAAAGLYGYTRDHLGLMIRQGKLNGMKLGNYYVVTNDWMLQYIKNFADQGHPASKNKMSNRFLTEAMAIAKKTKKTDTPSVSNAFSVKRPFREEPKNNLEKELSEELSILSASKQYLKEVESRNYVSAVKKSGNFENPELKLAIEHPYIILPIRKMNTDERENILNRTINKEVKKDNA